MTDRARQRRLDLLAMHFVSALEAGDFETVNKLWATAAEDPELEAVFTETAAALANVYEAEAQARVTEAIVEMAERHLPTAELIHQELGPVTVADVADFIRRHPPLGLTTDDMAMNDALRQSREVVPSELGMSQVLDWGRQFGSLSEVYWRGFRQAALKLRMRRESEATYQMAARQSTRKRPEAKP